PASAKKPDVPIHRTGAAGTSLASRLTSASVNPATAPASRACEPRTSVSAAFGMPPPSASSSGATCVESSPALAPILPWQRRRTVSPSGAANRSGRNFWIRAISPRMPKTVSRATAPLAMTVDSRSICSRYVLMDSRERSGSQARRKRIYSLDVAHICDDLRGALAGRRGAVFPAAVKPPLRHPADEFVSGGCDFFLRDLLLSAQKPICRGSKEEAWLASTRPAPGATRWLPLWRSSNSSHWRPMRTCRRNFAG